MTKTAGQGIQLLLELVVGGALAAYAVGFVSWNLGTDVATVTWMSQPARAYPLWLAVLVAFVVGFLFAAFLGSVTAIRHITEIRRSRKQVLGLQGELARLRGAAARSPSEGAA